MIALLASPYARPMSTRSANEFASRAGGGRSPSFTDDGGLQLRAVARATRDDVEALTKALARAKKRASAR